MYYKRLIKEAFNIENRKALSLQKKKILIKTITGFMIVLIFTIITNSYAVDLKNIMKNIFDFFIDFFQ